MTEVEFAKLQEKALKIYVEQENERLERELERANEEPVKFSKEHQRKMKKIFKLARKMEQILERYSK